MFLEVRYLTNFVLKYKTVNCVVFLFSVCDVLKLTCVVE